VRGIEKEGDMKLYHGTSEAVARTALEEGILPRDEVGKESNWDDCPSRGDMVYLTRAYAPYFAMCASEADGKWGLIEVDTEALFADYEEYEDEDSGLERYLYPDEDFLEQATRRGSSPCPDGLSMEERTAWFRDNLHGFQHLWRDSLEGLGNCACFGEVPAECVTKVVVFDPASNPTLSMMAMDPMISIMNYALVGGSKYRALTDWFFGHDVRASDIDMTLQLVEAGLGGEFMAKRASQLKEVLTQRSGIEVLS
jgi:hypothetical protein